MQLYHKAAIGVLLLAFLLPFAHQTFKHSSLYPWYSPSTTNKPSVQLHGRKSMTERCPRELTPSDPDTLRTLIEICEVHNALDRIGGDRGAIDFTSPATSLYDIFDAHPGMDTDTIMRNVMEKVVQMHRDMESKGASKYHHRLAGGIKRAGAILANDNEKDVKKRDFKEKDVYDDWVQPVVDSAKLWESSWPRHRGNDKKQVWADYRKQNGLDRHLVCLLAEKMRDNACLAATE